MNFRYACFVIKYEKLTSGAVQNYTTVLLLIWSWVHFPSDSITGQFYYLQNTHNSLCSKYNKGLLLQRWRFNPRSIHAEYIIKKKEYL